MPSANLPTSKASSDTETIDIFLSYNSSDRQLVQDFRELLLKRQVSTFFDRANLHVGLSWFDDLQDSLNKARAVAIFIGKSGLGTWQKREMALALDRQAREEKDKQGFPVIPILLPGAVLDDVPSFLLLEAISKIVVLNFHHGTTRRTNRPAVVFD